MGSLRHSFRRPLLLVEGLRDGAPVHGVSWAAVRGALINVCVCFGVPVLRAMDARDSASLIAGVARQLCAPLEIPYVRPGYRPMGWHKRALYILQGLPGVGPQRARVLLERFGSVTAVLGADVSALAEVSGIGESVARSIREAVGDSGAIRSPPSVVAGTDS